MWSTCTLSYNQAIYQSFKTFSLWQVPNDYQDFMRWRLGGMKSLRLVANAVPTKKVGCTTDFTKKGLYISVQPATSTVRRGAAHKRELSRVKIIQSHCYWYQQYR